MKRQRGHHVFLTLGKELRETLRDRRTVGIMILFPLVVYPLLSLLVTQVLANRHKQQEERPSQVAIVGVDPARGDLRQRLSAQAKDFVFVESATTVDVDSGKVDALVQVLAVVPSIRVEVAFDSTRDESRKAEERVSEQLEHVLPPGCQSRFDVARRDLASRTKLGGYVLSKVLPLMLVLMVLLGAFYPAIDVTAGERERGTLETILSSPVDRRDLLLGKVLAVTTLATITGVLNLASMSLTLVQVMRIAEPASTLPVPWTRAAATVLVILPSAFFASGLFVTVGSLARGFKEAQNLLMPVYFLILLPSMVGGMGELPLQGVAAVVPGLNMTLLAREIALGTLTWPAALLAVGSTLLYGFLALTLAAKLYDSERFLHVGESRRPGRAGDPRQPATTAPPAVSAGEAMCLFAIAYLLLYFVFVPLQQKSLMRGLLLSQWLGLLGLVVLFARLRGRRIADVLELRRPPARALLGAGLMGASAWVAVGLLSEWLLPVPKDLLEQMRKALLPEDGSRGLMAVLFLTAVTPAICEEALFRGPILRGLSGRLSPPMAIVLTGLLFGLFHMDVWRLLPTAVLGVMLSWLAWRSGSILPSMLAHALNNGVLLVLSSRHLDDRLAALGRPGQALVFAASLVTVGAGIQLCRRRDTAPHAPRR